MFARFRQWCTPAQEATTRPEVPAHRQHGTFTIGCGAGSRMLDARLEDGSRVAAMFPPCAVDAPTFIRPEVHAPIHAG
jgi:hypothetical protein